jgi:Fe-coproporphyrin III synthase
MLVSDEPDAGGSGVLMLHLLGRCNLRCAHCYMQGAPDRREMLAIEDVLDAISECSPLGIGSLYVTGGEPLLHPEIERVLEAGAKIKGMKTTLCTNATRLNERDAALFGELGLRLSISIDGDAAYHDSFRKRRGAFATAERGLNLAVAAGCEVTIISTISQRNLQMVTQLVNWAIDHGAHTFRAQPLLNLGRGELIRDDRMTSAQMDLLILTLSDLANRTRSFIRCSIIGQSRRFLQAHPCAAYVCNGRGCHRRVEKEIKKIVVREDGTVLPECTNLHHSYKIGVLGEAPLGEMVGRYLDLGYDRFDQLCRVAYDEMLADWPMAVVPWDQIIAERSQHEVRPVAASTSFDCGSASRMSHSSRPTKPNSLERRATARRSRESARLH